PEGRRDLDQLGRLDLRLGAWPRPPRPTRRQPGAGEVRRDAREGHGGHGRVRLHDQGPRAPGRPRPEVAFDHRLPRQDRREPEEGDGGLRPLLVELYGPGPVWARLFSSPRGPRATWRSARIRAILAG